MSTKNFLITISVPTVSTIPIGRQIHALLTKPEIRNITKDIAATLGAEKGDRLLVGFALETDNEQAHAEAKLTKKNFDFVVLNSLRDAGAGFRGDTNKVTFIDRSGREELPLLSKQEVAVRIVERITKLLFN